MQLYLNISFFLSAQHWVTINGVKGEAHNHIWEISLKISGDKFCRPDLEVGFLEVESIVKGYLSLYENKILNLAKPFDRLNPSTENMGLFFAQSLQKKLAEHGLALEELTLRESPTRGFTVSGLQGEQAAAIGISACPADFFLDQGTEVDNFEAQQEPEADREDAPPTQHFSVVDTGKEIAAGTNFPAIAHTPWRYVLGALFFIFIFHLLLYAPILFGGTGFPWGSDAWAHLFKTEFLFDSIKAGDYFPRYMSGWDNGIDPFRYWAPLSYYILVFFNFLAGDVFRGFNIFLFAASFISSSSWLLFRNRSGLANTVIWALAWALAPYNLAVAFASGNAPGVAAFSFLPLLIYLVTEIQRQERPQKLTQILLILTLNMVILSHAMLAAVFLVCLALYVLILFMFGGSTLKSITRTLFLFCVSLLLASWWLIPSQVGGVNAINREAVVETLQYYSPLVSLNPLHRLTSPEAFYLGLGYVLCAAAALFRWRSRNSYQKAAILLGLFVFAMTTPVISPIYNKLPLSHLLWPERFVSAGIAFLVMGAVDINGIKSMLKNRRIVRLGLALSLIVILFADSYISVNLIKTRDFPTQVDEAVGHTLAEKGFKAAVLDLSRLGSVPSYLVTEKYNKDQIFGAAWQGAQTSQNLMLLNQAIEKEWYPYLFDRLIEMGGTHLIVKNDVIKDHALFRDEAIKAGFTPRGEKNGLSTYTVERGPYLVSAEYKILGIGRFASNIAMAFPEVRLGQFNEVDKYSLEELLKYKTILLSGFNWVSRKQAEDLVLEYVKKGGRVVIDLTGAPRDVLSNRTTFLGVVAEPVVIEDSPLINVGSREIRLSRLPEANMPWKTFVLEGIDKVSSLVNYYDRKRPIEGYKVYHDKNIYFIGLNLPYYGFLTKDENVLNMLRDLLQSRVGQTVPRATLDLEKLAFRGKTGEIEFNLPREYSNRNMVIPLAYLPTMEINTKGPQGAALNTTHNLIGIAGREGEYKMSIMNKWPESTATGGLLSLLGVIILLLGLTGINILVLLKKTARTAVLLLPLLVLLPAVASAQNVAADGEFSEWTEDRSFVDDKLGDIMNVSDRTEVAGDTRRLYWSSNPGEANLYFSVIRYEPKDLNHKMTGKLFFDINNNGKYNDEVDKVTLFRYDPNAGKVAVKVCRVNDQNNAPSWHEIGNWGAKKNSPEKGLQFEFYIPFDKLGIIANQTIRYYAVTSFIKNDNPKQEDDWVLDPSFDDDILFKHDFDLIPDTGDIQIVPVPFAGYTLLGLIMALGLAGGVFLLINRKTGSHG